MNNFSYDSLQDGQTIAKYFQILAEGIASGRLSFGEAGTELILEPKGLLHFKTEADTRLERCELRVSVIWKKNDGCERQEQGF